MEPQNSSLLRTSLSLYGTFARIGFFMFGGGYAMLPLLQKECVDKHHWTDEEEILDVFAMAQCTPGIISVNTATYIGKKQAGLLGSALATLGLITPSILLITLIAALLSNFADLAAVQHALAAIRAVVTALIFASVVKMGKGALKHPVQVAIALLAFLAVALFGTSPVVIVVAAALIGFLYFGLLRKEKEADA
ncbi:MAG: chromate transporter [Clostridia bacterium]|nr:chromate transporter [Clostridia bacterium]MBQ8469294.1 chromate transporter [Clostridia bacterium]MBR1704097.1 chromate transporter [Clostridia bacterium]